MCAIARLFLIALLAGLGAAGLSAQEPKIKAGAGAKQPELPYELQDFWQKDAGANMRGWAACAGQVPPAGGAWNPWGAVGARLLVGNDEKGLPDWKFVFDEALPIWHRYLELIRDDRKLPSIERKEIKDLRGSDFGMYSAMAQAIDRSHTATLDMFKKSAAANDHVGYKHLRKQPAKYRGQVVSITGRITWVDKWDALRYVNSDILYVYTANIQGPLKNEPPYAVLFTELPQGVPYNKKIDLEVTFHGYFLAHVLFPGDPKKQEKDITCPYLIGRTLIVDKFPPPAVETGSYSYDLIVGSVGAIVAILVLTVMLNFWFRRADRRVESQLAQVRDKHQPFSLEPAELPPPLAEPIAVPAPPTENGAPPAS